MFYRAQLDREGDRWLVEFEDCPGCQTFGGSREHALERAQEALEGWLEATLDLRRLPPRPLARAGVPVYVNDKLSVSLQLRLAREEQGLSQSEVAGRAGLSQQQIARLESPDNNPTLQGVSAAANALGLRLELVSDVAEAIEVLPPEVAKMIEDHGPSANDNPRVKATRAPAPQRRRLGTH